jgi:hypothetical protein
MAHAHPERVTRNHPDGRIDVQGSDMGNGRGGVDGDT